MKLPTFTIIAVIVILVLAMAPLLQTTLAIILQGQRKTIGSGELGFVIGHQIGKSDAMNGNMTNQYKCVKPPDDPNYCVGYALGYKSGWREVTGEDIELPLK